MANNGVLNVAAGVALGGSAFGAILFGRGKVALKWAAGRVEAQPIACYQAFILNGGSSVGFGGSSSYTMTRRADIITGMSLRLELAGLVSWVTTLGGADPLNDDLGQALVAGTHELVPNQIAQTFADYSFGQGSLAQDPPAAADAGTATAPGGATAVAIAYPVGSNGTPGSYSSCLGTSGSDAWVGCMQRGWPAIAAYGQYTPALILEGIEMTIGGVQADLIPSSSISLASELFVIEGKNATEVNGVYDTVLAQIMYSQTAHVCWMNVPFFFGFSATQALQLYLVSFNSVNVNTTYKNEIRNVVEGGWSFSYGQTGAGAAVAVPVSVGVRLGETVGSQTAANRYGTNLPNNFATGFNAVIGPTSQTPIPLTIGSQFTDVGRFAVCVNGWVLDGETRQRGALLAQTSLIFQHKTQLVSVNGSTTTGTLVLPFICVASAYMIECGLAPQSVQSAATIATVRSAGTLAGFPGRPLGTFGGPMNMQMGYTTKAIAGLQTSINNEATMTGMTEQGVQDPTFTTQMGGSPRDWTRGNRNGLASVACYHFSASFIGTAHGSVTGFGNYAAIESITTQVHVPYTAMAWMWTATSQLSTANLRISSIIVNMMQYKSGLASIAFS